VDHRWAQFKGLGALMRERSLRLLFPAHCLGCRVEVMEPGTLCGNCWPKVRFLDEPWCEVLGTPFAHPANPGMVSIEAIASPPPFRRARSAVLHDGVARQMVLGLKFRDRTEMAPWMARWMVRAGRDLLRNADLVAAVPLHRGRFFMRRFNQAAELARAVARQSGIAFDPGIVERVRPTRQQVGLPHKERRANVKGAFKVADHAKARLSGRTVLLIDDVYTTGATVGDAAKALIKGGAANVDVLTFSRVMAGDFLQGEPETI
jgi:ComF family protein